MDASVADYAIPRVVGYIVLGVLLGSSVAGIIPLDLVSRRAPMTDLALGLIGFMIGSELKGSVFQQSGRQLVVIMLAEGLAAFVAVTALVTACIGDFALGILPSPSLCARLSRRSGRASIREARHRTRRGDSGGSGASP